MATRDYNICELCNLYVPLDERICRNCGQSVVLEAVGKLSLWRLGDIEDGIVGHIAHNLTQAFSFPVVIHPTFLDERPSRRPTWRGISSNVFLDQVHRRQQKGSFVSVGITEENIVPDARHNFLFGYAYLGFPAAVISLYAMKQDNPSAGLLIARASNIAVHEIGHTLGLDHHGYEDGVDCVMVGDDEIDSLETLDEGTCLFCEDCKQTLTEAFAAPACPPPTVKPGTNAIDGLPRFVRGTTRRHVQEILHPAGRGALVFDSSKRQGANPQECVLHQVQVFRDD
jgi:predicted Zn-dependent protease